VLTARGFSRTAFMGGVYDAQDILVDIDDAELIHLKPRSAREILKSVHARLVWYDFTKTLVFANAAFEPIHLRKHYDLFVAYFPCCIASHLIQIAAVRGLRDYCKASVCWIDEIYARDIPTLTNWLPALKQFDHVVVGYGGSVAAISKALDRPCHWVPSGVDAVRFSPSPRPPARAIDVYCMGRRPESLHRALLEIAAKNNLFYLYDTFDTSMTDIVDYRQHRSMLANIMKRTKIFPVAPAKAGSAAATNQIELGFRYYEGAAAGAVMVGEIPRCQAFDTLFDWPDALIEVRSDGSDAADVIGALADEPERLAQISRRNAREALLRHDWAYRWRKILAIAGLLPAPQLEVRERTLRHLAEQIEAGVAAPV
jgi:hypothetical protein